LIVEILRKMRDSNRLYMEYLSLFEIYQIK
jgi:hypothetical protein